MVCTLRFALLLHEAFTFIPSFVLNKASKFPVIYMYIVFFQPVLESFIHHAVQVRHQALKVIQLILNQGLVHPVQVSHPFLVLSPFWG